MFFQPIKLQSNDIPSLMELERAAFPSDQWSEEQIKDEFLNHPDGFRIIKKGDKVIAYIYFQKEEEGIIYSLAVDKKERRTGLGKLLMEIAVNTLSKQRVPKVVLYTRENNLPMISLSKKLGFKIVDKIDNYYPKSGTAIVLNLAL